MRGTRTHDTKLRRATAADAPALAALYHRAYGARKVDGQVFRALDEPPEQVLRYILDDHTLVVEENGQLVGSVSLRGVGNVRRLAVDPAAQGQGLGARLLEEAVAASHARGDSYAELSTAPDHPWLAEFYARHGFDHRGELILQDGSRWTVQRRAHRQP